MFGGSIWAGLFGGLGLFLLGTRRIRSGLAEYVERISAALSWRGMQPRGALASGLSLAALLLGSDELPVAASRMARARGLRPERATLVAIGASGGPVIVCVLAVLVSFGWALPAAAMLALLGAAILMLVGRKWLVGADALAGSGLVILGIVAMDSGWNTLAQSGYGSFGFDGAAGAAILFLTGGLAGTLLRSPTALACMALQATAVGLVHAGSGMALLAGIAASTSAGFLEPFRRGSADQRATAAGHALFGLLWGGFMLLFVIGSSSVMGFAANVPGGPGVALLLLLAACGALAGLLTSALLGPLEALAMAHTDAVHPARRELVWHDVPGLFASELHRLLEDAAESTRDLARGVLGTESTTRKRGEQAIADLDGALQAIHDLLARHGHERVPLSIGCSVHAARGGTEALRILAVHLDQHEPVGSFGDRALDLRLLQLRLGILQLIETSRPGDSGFTLERWEQGVIEAQASAAELWSQAAAACGAGPLPPIFLTKLKAELETLCAIVREIDRAVSEWATLVPGLTWEQASAEREVPLGQPVVGTAF